MKFGRFSHLALIAAIGIFTLLAGSSASALSGADFKPGRIMDDVIFFDSKSMTANQIQEFLNAKVPECDTLGEKESEYGSGTRAEYGVSRGYSLPYTCLKDYKATTPSKVELSGVCTEYVGGTEKSAAQIIHAVSQACGINPQVLLVKLETNSSLVTDDWPWSYQYKNAMGVGCPDDGLCDPNYVGFFNQVYNSAKLLKTYTVHPEWYSFSANKLSSIRYHPTNEACGSSQVFIETQATAALYNYTPYQPNSAALSDLDGYGDACSSLGNRNFWRVFNDWFGSTLYTPPTFESLEQSLDSVEAYRNSLQATRQLINVSENSYARGDISTATTTMKQATRQLDLLVEQTKLSELDSNRIKEMIEALVSSW